MVPIAGIGKRQSTLRTSAVPGGMPIEHGLLSSSCVGSKYSLRNTRSAGTRRSPSAFLAPANAGARRPNAGSILSATPRSKIAGALSQPRRASSSRFQQPGSSGTTKQLAMMSVKPRSLAPTVMRRASIVRPPASCFAASSWPGRQPSSAESQAGSTPSGTSCPACGPRIPLTMPAPEHARCTKVTDECGSDCSRRIAARAAPARADRWQRWLALPARRIAVSGGARRTRPVRPHRTPSSRPSRR